MKTKLLLVTIVIFSAVNVSHAQRDVSKEILVYFIKGVNKDTLNNTLGNSKIRITSSNVKNKLVKYGILENAIKPAFNKFKEADTLKITRDGRKVKQLNYAKVYKITIPKRAIREKIIEELSALPEVLFAEPNVTADIMAIPDDTYFSSQWNLNNTGSPRADIRAVEAWNMY